MSLLLKPSYTLAELWQILEWQPRRLRRYLAKRRIPVDRTDRGSHFVWLADLKSAAPEMWSSIVVAQQHAQPTRLPPIQLSLQHVA